MSKSLEALECSLKLYKMVESAGNDNGFSLNEAWEYHETIKQALLELKAIKEANPSKAMECLERIDKEYATIENEDFKICFNAIKQALLKAQEQEQEKENQELKDTNMKYAKIIDDFQTKNMRLEKTLEILKKYLYYDNKNHFIKMKEVRKSIYNFDYEDLKEMLENE